MLCITIEEGQVYSCIIDHVNYSIIRHIKTHDAENQFEFEVCCELASMSALRRGPRESIDLYVSWEVEYI
jgi:hypothetical protein